LPKPLKCAELKRLLQREHAPVDVSPLHACGLAYTASPLFEDPNDDPLPLGRLVMLDGDSCATTFDAEVSKPSPLPSHRPPPRMSLQGDGCAMLSAACMTIREAGEGDRHKTIFDQCRDLAKLIAVGYLDEDYALFRITRAGVAIGKGETEIKRIFNDTLRYCREQMQMERGNDGTFNEEASS
jgi:hypothetical protein